MKTRLNVADLAGIETRVSAWIAGCEPLLEVFRLKRDPYLDFASKMYHIPYEVLEADLHSSDPVKKAAAKFMRQMAKPGVLRQFIAKVPVEWARIRRAIPRN